MQQWFLSWSGRDGRVEKRSGCELPSQYVQRWSWNNKHTQTHMIWPKFLEWMWGSGFRRKHRLRTFHAHESHSTTATIVSLLTERGSSLENKVRRVDAGDATRWCCPHFGVSMVLCPLIVCWQLQGNGNSKWLCEMAKTPIHISYPSMSTDNVEKTLSWLSDRAHKKHLEVWGFEFISFTLLCLLLLWKVSAKCQETTACWNITSGIIWHLAMFYNSVRDTEH